MSLNQQQKSHLGRIENTLDNLSNTTELNNIVTKKTLDIISTFSAGKNLYIDDDIKNNISSVSSRLMAGAGLELEIDNEIAALLHRRDVEIPAIPRVAGTADPYTAEIRDISTRLGELTRIKTGIVDRHAEYADFQSRANSFNTTPANAKVLNASVNIIELPPRTGGINASQNLDTLFMSGGIPVGATHPQYTLCDDTGKPILHDAAAGGPGGTYTLTIGGQTAKITGITFTGVPLDTIDLTNATVTPTSIDLSQPLKLSITGSYAPVHGITVAHNKPFQLQLSKGPAPIPRDTIGSRDADFAFVESNLTPGFLETRLKQDFDNKFNKLQREAFEKALSTNPEFAKLNQSQKDRIYERMQTLGAFARGAVDINLGNVATPIMPLTTPPTYTYTAYPAYAINDLTFSPSTHTYSVMPNNEDYLGFKNWLVNQAPKDVLTDSTKYREWLRNGLVASLDNGKTHYESFFADVLKQFTDDVNVKTTLNKTLLDFINDTNEANPVSFAARLHANFTATKPTTTYTKKGYQRLAFWKQGEAQNYLSFFHGQSDEFKAESITAGGKTFSYSGKLDINSAESVSMSLKMKDGEEQIYNSGSPVSLVHTLLTSPDIEPPHARFHAGLSVIKSVTKLARSNGISLRTALTLDMLNTLPIGIRTTLTTPPAQNPMVEIEEVNGKLVAKVFNLNLVTRRKENEYKMFDEQEFVATQSVRDLRQGVESLLALTNQTLNATYAGYRQARRGSSMRRAFLQKHRYGGLANLWKTISFEGETISVGGKTFTLDCKKGLFTFTGQDLKKPISGKNLGDLLAYNPALRGIELKALHVANEKMVNTYQDKLKKSDRLRNYGVIDEANHRVYILDKAGNLGYVENTSQDFAKRWRQFTSGRSYGRIKDGDMPIGFRVMKRGDTVVDKESYENFLRNESLVGPMVRAMSRTHRAVTTWAPWD